MLSKRQREKNENTKYSKPGAALVRMIVKIYKRTFAEHSEAGQTTKKH